MQIRNPRTGQADYVLTPASANGVADVVARCRAAQPAWWAGGVAERVAALHAWQRALLAHRPALLDALTTDTGRRSESEQEFDLVLRSVDRWCRTAPPLMAPPARRPSAIPFIQIEQDVVPYAVVGVISPWNFPLLLSLIDTIPALLAGCAVVVKPSEVTPRFVEPLRRSIAEVPALAAVFDYVVGGPDTGAALVDTADLICFTGSTATGRAIYRRAAERFMPVFLELGGKDAALVFADADLARAATALLWGSVVNAGQSCLSIERIYVQDVVYDAFVQRLAEQARALQLAYPTPADGQLGPIIAARQIEIINAHLADALAQGATLQTGEPQCVTRGGGTYCYPTVLTNVHHGMRIMTEETFGPIMPVMAFRTEAEAVALANDTPYGLSGAVFTGSAARSLAIGRQLVCGAVSLNDAALTAVMHEGEKNAFRLSGIGGTRMGPAAIRRFVRQKAYLINGQAAPSPWWFRT